MAKVNISESAIQENSATEVHNDEQAQTEVSAAEQPEYSAVSSVPGTAPRKTDSKK